MGLQGCFFRKMSPKKHVKTLRKPATTQFFIFCTAFLKRTILFTKDQELILSVSVLDASFSAKKRLTDVRPMLSFRAIADLFKP